MVTASPLNRFERVLMLVALAVAGVVVVLRVGAMLLVSFLHHFR
jgi:hypothetical protein